MPSLLVQFATISICSFYIHLPSFHIHLNNLLYFVFRLVSVI